MQKRQEIELLRIISAFGIVWFHCSTVGKDIAYSGLIVFLILSMYFSSRPSATPKPIGERAKRLLIPWGLWCLFYGVINLILKKPFIKLDNGILAGILAGPSIHLWYLPYIFISIILFDRLKKYLNGPALSYIAAITVAVIFSLTEFWRPWSKELGAPWGQYMHALNGILIGVFLANCRTLVISTLIALLSLVLTAIFVFALSEPGIGTPYLIGILAASIVLLPNWHVEADWKISGVSECTLGIYLSHPFWLLAIAKLGVLSKELLPFAVFCFSAIFVWCFKKIFPRMASYVV